jgi:hypothetical protein
VPLPSASARSQTLSSTRPPIGVDVRVSLGQPCVFSVKKSLMHAIIYYTGWWWNDFTVYAGLSPTAAAAVVHLALQNAAPRSVDIITRTSRYGIFNMSGTGCDVDGPAPR